MCREATVRLVKAAALLVVAAFGAQSQPVSLDWRHIGNSAIEQSMPAVTTGPVDRVWYSQDGATLYTRTASGRIFETTDFEQWKRVQDQSITPPVAAYPEAVTLPEPGLKVRSQPGEPGRFYGVGRNAYRSDDGGLNWTNLTAYKGASILGDGLADLAVSPRFPDEVVVASHNGVWRSMDSGLTWTGLNQFLPNLPTRHLMGVPTGPRGVRLSLAGGGNTEIEWAPGEKTAWRPVDSADLARENITKAALSQLLKHAITAVATAKDYIYTGDSEGRLQVSPDAGASWPQQFKLADLGSVESIWVDANDPRVAVAALAARPSSASQPQAKPTYVLRTMNGGIFWDDITSNLPDTAAAHGVAADRASGAVYIATDAGVFFTLTDLASAGAPTSWASLSANLPTAATDVKLDAGANQLYVAVDGYGVYASIAPHRFRDARVVSAADYSSRPTAPGALLSVLGTRVESARSADTVVPVLDASNTASQIQVPFEAKGNTLSLSLDAAAGRMTVGLPLQSVSPAIFVDPEGTPLILDADSGVLLDASKPAHSNTRIQILATGLGLVKPDWPTGMAAPRTDPPRVVATVHAYLDRLPVDVTQASLAPGYIGFYLIEVQLPQIVNAGPAELSVEAEGQQSNRVRLYIEP
jgi:uncharacterized protein (TIGR03437 family)